MSELSYKLVKDYRNNINLVNKYHVFISKIFPSISFKEWQNKGFWTNKYIPFSIVKNDEIVSNVSVAIMDVFLNGKKLVAAQIGAVGTLPEYRNKGLSRDLMNYVIEKFKDDVQLFFLFANETVMEYYPKFGFKNFHENIFTSETNINGSHCSAKKLNLNDKKDYILLIELLKRRKVITKILVDEKYDFITM